MPRLPKPWWREERQCWYVKINGKMTRLDPDEKKATQMFYNLLRENPDPSPRMLVVDLLDRYLVWSETSHSKATRKRVSASINSFAESVPAGLRVNKLLPSHLSQWITKRCPKRPPDGSKPVSDNTRRDYLADVMGAFTWAASPEQKIIPYSPFNGYRKPKKTPRAACFTAEQWEQVFAEIKVKDPFYDFMLVVRNTGCRPQEARIAAARHIDAKAKKLHFKAGEVPGKPWDIDVFLDDESLAILQKWALEYPEGPVFRNKRGRPWTKNSLNSRFQRMKEKLPFRAHCYVARHTKAVELLETGASAGAVAAILGHKDPTMVLKVYGKHIESRDDHLRECLDRAPTMKKPDVGPDDPKAAAS